MDSIDDFILNAEQLVASDLTTLASSPDNSAVPEDESIATAHHVDQLDDFIMDLVNTTGVETPKCSANHQNIVAVPECPPCHHDDCNIPDYSNIWKDFVEMDVSSRVSVVRNMLFATISPKGGRNCLAGNTAMKRAENRKRKRGEVNNRSTVVYSVRGLKVCRTTFSHLVSLDDKTVERHANKVANGEGLVIHGFKQSESRKGKHGIQGMVVAGFLAAYGHLHGLECPTGRGSRHEKPLLMLSSATTKVDVHDAYKKDWPLIIDAAMEITRGSRKPSGPLSYNLFVRHWEEDFQTLRIAKSGSDFCDLCTALKDDLVRFTSSDERHAITMQVLERHRRDSKQEFLFYKQCQENSISDPHSNTRHFVFDFAEKVLLPKVQKQPGQLHFVTGLKFDIFGVSSSNKGVNYIFGLPEGHWPNEKTANIVCSMMHYQLTQHRLRLGHGSNARHLQLHADNCSGQNKNRFMLWYLCWRVIMGLDDEIELYFLVAGHTKNVCDGAFGHIKRCLKVRDVRTPADMMNVIKDSSRTTVCVPSAKVTWFMWKDFLSCFFSIPSRFQISKYHVFSMSQSKPGIVQVRKLTSDTEGVSFNLLRAGKCLTDLRDAWELALENNAYASKITPLDHVPSAQKSTRKGYLTHNILDRYYKNHCVLRENFFSDGTGLV